MLQVKLIDKMGTDLSVVNAARVSFDKQSKWQQVDGKLTLKDGDVKLINYLAKHNHWTPFGHASLSFHIKAPIFVARQLVKHTVGLVWNEVSRRYVDSKPELYFPDKWRKRNEDKKQGSHENEFVDVEEDIEQNCNKAVNMYLDLLKTGVCPEQARMVLPQNTMTEWYWSGSLIAFARVCNLRCKPDTQLETRLVANQIDNIVYELFPVAWKALIDK